MPPSWEPPEVTLAPPARGNDLALAAACGIRAAVALDPATWQFVRNVRGGLDLRAPDAMGGWQLELDLSSGPLARRLRTSRPDEPLPRAIGLTRRQEPLRVVDATAGLCRDALVLAHLGCRVVAIERVPALVMLVQAALDRSSMGDRLQVVASDAIAWLAARPAAEAPDVVYLDPMFTEAGKAQVKKDMQVCRALAGPPQDLDLLFATARRTARARVVVKRAPDGMPLAPGASFTVDGERVRFDVYLQ